ncbi:Hypothetical predicted protein [Mytilus galloprovincialis]|uniref:VWFD domain-containing protein n=1 Tax=Mytilus galloprovincialis TaxID=29158 RepID=A0A8B6DD06_MYTGA|nr:Hypothetical predicted protein [Mytilus galloprovincialis]
MLVELCLSSFIFCIVGAGNQEPCETNNFIDNWKRSVAYEPDNPNLCDSFLLEDWYRVVSGAGELMPTECPIGGWRCGTTNPIWLSKEGVKDGETTYPDVGKTVSRIGYAVSDDNCNSKKYPIKIKNCGHYHVYYLKPVRGCLTAYCFGAELPCPAGLSSETGFTPGCGTFTNTTVSPKLSVKMHKETIDGKIHLTPKFKCTADDATEEYNYDVKYYINNVEIDSANNLNVSYEDLEQAALLQSHWEDVFKPNMFVKCSMQVRAEGYTSPGPKTFSDQFFAGIKVPNNERGFAVKEGKTLKIPIEFTLPVGCIFPVDSRREKSIRENLCFVELYNAIPKYQRDKCENEDLKFLTEQCGIKISNSNWQEQHFIEIIGQIDNKINMRDRLTFLRLWSDPKHGSNIKHLGIWKSVHVPDIKVLIIDTDKLSLGRACQSNNDPHMRNFQGRRWELQNNFPEPSTGEYIMYKHDRLPQQINAFFRICGGALCNCGVAVRSANSLFVANFCETIYKGQRRANRYVASWLCDDQNLIIEENTNKYKVQLPSGTQVEFSHGPVSNFYGIHRIQISPSLLDSDHTSGLCGRYNDKDTDDFIDRNTNLNIPQDIWRFAKSWKVDGTAESLFSLNGKLPELKFFLQEYCTCNTPQNGRENPPIYTCLSSTEMKNCKQTQTSKSVYHASCLTSTYRNKRDISNIEDIDERPPMFPMYIEPDEDHVASEVPMGWKNGFTEEIAKNKCQDAFVKTLAYAACSTYVPSVNAQDYVKECIEDMKIVGDDRFLKVTLENFASTCLGNAKKMENLTVTNRTETENRTESANETEARQSDLGPPLMMSILEVIEQATCPDNCSGNGVCQNGVCGCNDDYFGVDCSLEKTKAPLIEKSAFESICDNSERPCKKFIIPGLDFYPKNLTCKFRPFKFIENETQIDFQKSEETFTHRGIYRSIFLMFCEIPESRRRRSADVSTIANGYFISISNDGLNYTEELAVVSFDTRCYSCNVTDFWCTKEYQLDCPLRKQVNVIDVEDNTVYIGVGIGVGIVIIIFVALGIFIYCRKQTKETHRGYEFTKERIPMTETHGDQQSQEHEEEEVTLLRKSKTS